MIGGLYSMSNQSALYEITTEMDKNDYRKFSYMTIFKKKVKTVLLILLLATVGSGLAATMIDTYSVPKILLIWVILVAACFAAIFLRVEYKAMNRMNQVRLGLTGGRQYLTFYENHLIAEQENVKGSNKIKYDNLRQVLETGDYYIIYAGANSASMIRKIDIHKEDREEFGNFLKRRLGDRYKKK